MGGSARNWPRNIVVDAGVLVAAIDRDEPAHAWAVRTLTGIPGRFFTCEACITEAVHLLGNSAPAVERLGQLLVRMTIVEFGAGKWSDPLADVVRYAPAMDFADACIVHIVRHRRHSFALTLDRSDFATYRVPFACPEGEFYL